MPDALTDAWDDLQDREFNLHCPLDPDVLKLLRWIPKGRHSFLCLEEEGQEPARALFSVIGRIQDSLTTFKLTPDGGWDGVRGTNGNLKYDSKFKKVILSALVGKPFNTDNPATGRISDTWGFVISNMDKLVDTMKGTGRVQGVFPEERAAQTPPADRALKISHRLFKDAAADGDASSGNDENAVDVSTHSSLTRAGWPLKPGSAASAALKDLEPSVKLVPLPAYDGGQVILPAQYSILQGALVRVDFYLSHVNLEGTKEHFTAEISRIERLKPRLVMLASSPKKKRRLQNGAGLPMGGEENTV